MSFLSNVKPVKEMQKLFMKISNF